jgi:FAD/FMN-containing dehydrogenase
MTQVETGSALDPQAVRRFATELQGNVIGSDDPAYDKTRRVWNGMIDRRPALIAQCLGVADITRSLAFAREHALPVTVRGGGHSVGGKAVADGALMIDLRRMSWVKVDPERRTARVGPGALGADLDRESPASVGGQARPGRATGKAVACGGSISTWPGPLSGAR